MTHANVRTAGVSLKGKLMMIERKLMMIEGKLMMIEAEVGAARLDHASANSKFVSTSAIDRRCEY